MYLTIKIINYILIILSILCLYFKLKKSGISMLMSISSWFMLYFTFYFLIPSAFIETVNIRENWMFSEETIIISRLLVSSIFLMYFGMYSSLYFVKTHRGLNDSDRISVVYVVAYFVYFLSFILTSMFIVNLIKNIHGNKFDTMYLELRNTGGFLEQKYHIKKMIYLGMASIYYLYLRDKKKRYFLLVPLFLIGDFLSGSRTNSFIYVIFVYFVLVKETGKTYLKQVVLAFAALLSLTMLTRASTLAKDGLSIISLVSFSMGEFFQTYLTLPYIIQNNLFGLGDIQNLSVNTFSSLLPGFIQSKLQIFTGFYGFGNDIAITIGRGYGLGCNYVTELLYSLGLWGLVFLPLIFIFIQILDDILYNDQYFIIKILIVIRLRLFLREGFPGFITVIYIFIMYFAFFFFFRRKKINRLELKC